MVSKRKTISILEQAVHDRNMDAIEDAKLLANVSETIAALEAEVEMWHDRFLALQPVAFNNATRAEKAEATIERLKCCGNCANVDEDHDGCYCVEIAATEHRASWDALVAPWGRGCAYFTPSRWTEREVDGGS